MVISMSSETQSTFLHKSNAYVLYEQTKWILAEDDEDGFDSDSDSEASSDDIEKCMIEEIVEDIKVYIQCLVDLGSALECPAFDPDFDEDETDMTRVKTHTAYDYYSDLIMDKYPNVNRDLADCLGKANWERYQRLQSERMRNEQTSVASTEQREVVVSKSCFSSSEFHDSGLGTSLSAQDVTYPETVISYISSVSNSRRISIPPLSLEARDGRQFECLACSKYIRATTNRAWR
jgi:hypothetical protein